MELFGVQDANNEKTEQEKAEFREALKEYMLNVVHYMYEKVHFQYTKITRDVVEKRVDDVIDFLLQLDEVSNLSNSFFTTHAVKVGWNAVKQFKKLLSVLKTFIRIKTLKANWTTIKKLGALPRGLKYLQAD